LAVQALLQLRLFGLDPRGWVYVPRGSLPEPLVDGGVLEAGGLPNCRRTRVGVFVRERGRRRVYELYAPGEGVLWLKRLGLIGGSWYEAAIGCGPRMPLMGRTRLSREAAYELVRLWLGPRLWRFWPRAAPRGHTLIFGASGTGKTTLAKHLLACEKRYIVLDPRGEYCGLGLCAEASVDLREMDSLDVARAFLAAASATGGEAEAFSAVQLGVLRHLPLGDPCAALEALSYVPMPELTRQVLRAKLMSLVTRLQPCEPDPRLTRDPPQADRLILRLPEEPFLAALIVHALIIKLLRRGHSGVVLIDEYHRYAPKAAVEDAAEMAIREGRHAGTRFILVTQSPRDVKPQLIAAATSIAVFRLGGEDAEIAARAVGAPTEAVRSLAVGEWLGRVAYSPTRHPPT